LRALGASAQYVFMRGLTEAALERMREMGDADTREAGKIVNRYLCMQVSLNVARNAADLPRREAPAHMEQCASVTMVVARRFPVAGQLVPGCFEHFRRRR
jgi:hypothetical protein